MNSLRPLDALLWPSKQQQGIVLSRCDETSNSSWKVSVFEKRPAICEDIIRGFANISLFLGVGFWGQHLCFGTLYRAEPSGGAQQKHPTVQRLQESAKLLAAVMAWRLFRMQQEWIVSLWQKWVPSPLCAPGSTWVSCFCLTQTMAWAQESCAEGEETDPLFPFS